MTCTGTKGKTNSAYTSPNPAVGSATISPNATGPVTDGPVASTISLNVLPTEHPKIKKSKASKWRAVALISIYAIIAIHILQWWKTGMTVSPVEPSESMYTLELGKVNAGFIFFVAAIASTLLFGRFFCGWGCHIVALQDWCGWIMQKCGVHPKPFRSRLLIWGPLLLAIYMFVVPTFRREVMMPLWAKMHWKWLPEFGEVVPRQVFTNAIMVDDFWRTFPPLYIAIPFLIVCGFVIVYFLGNKSFCSYGCPYGGFFAVADRFAIGKIKVNDNCEQCGHCTAVCTSNVRVHEEVRDFGQVVDPGCMKCLDCVSVCPNDALSVGFGAPNIFAKPKNADAEVRRQTVKKVYDFTWPQEILFFVMGLLMFFGFRSMANSVPLLMAAGLAAIGVFFVFKAWETLTHANVRLAHLQAKLKGKLKFAGMFCILIALGFITASGWGVFVRYNLWRAEMLDARVDGDFNNIFSATYKPDPEMQARAAAAMRHYTLAGPRAEGGFGWKRVPGDYKRMAWLSAVAGDLTSSQKWLEIAGDLPGPTADTYTGVTRIMTIQNRPASERLDFLRKAIKKQPQMIELRFEYFNTLMTDGQLQPALLEADALIAERPSDPHALHLAGLIYREMNRPGQMLGCFKKAVELEPNVAGFHFDLAQALFGSGDVQGAELHLQLAQQLDPNNAPLADTIAKFYGDLGFPEKQKEYEQIAAKIRASQPPAPGQSNPAATPPGGNTPPPPR